MIDFFIGWLVGIPTGILFVLLFWLGLGKLAAIVRRVRK